MEAKPELACCSRFLNEDGFIVCYEPAFENLKEEDIKVISLIRGLQLSLGIGMIRKSVK